MYTSSQLAKVLYRKLRQGDARSETTIDNFIAWLEAKNLSALTRPTLTKALKLIVREAEVETVVIKTSHVLSTKAKNKIKTLVGAAEGVPCVEQLDPSLIGGFTASFSYFLYDASLKQKLKELELALTK
ncbi:MAG: hypothetical protein A2589_01980 [Candidatus Vogelbacteria bacterium RIFOXYD1_FULL_46_19]|uniref:Uncharacterized protein n=1 Tax=Candidatus Vogelbacteria bacterium RIFOXYD1_FULL_46_19 TaxID=1802439 RepID=A0A1G2QGR8_9BACT|nr:MAG: hypothetical protein A2589_01980 [Candidatus Vogelbacteria bacterium RIFOXYD1_FULL_46_19]